MPEAILCTEEPPMDSVVLDVDKQAWQRTMAGWVITGCECHIFSWAYLIDRRGPLTLIWSPMAEPARGSIVADSDGDFWQHREGGLWYVVQLRWEHTGVSWEQLKENGPLTVVWSPDAEISD